MLFKHWKLTLFVVEMTNGLIARHCPLMHGPVIEMTNGLFLIELLLFFFIEYNDANRVLICSNMQCQVVSLSRFRETHCRIAVKRQVNLDLGKRMDGDRKIWTHLLN